MPESGYNRKSTFHYVYLTNFKEISSALLVINVKYGFTIRKISFVVSSIVKVSMNKIAS